MLSQSCVYALQASLYIATQPQGEYIAVARIAEALNISTTFLSKILHELTRQGLLTATRGAKGGVMLSRPMQDVRLLDVVYAIDGDRLFTECLLNLPGCGNRTPCPLHGQWGAERERLRRMFASATLEAMGQKVKDLGLQIANVPFTAETFDVAHT